MAILFNTDTNITNLASLPQTRLSTLYLYRKGPNLVIAPRSLDCGEDAKYVSRSNLSFAKMVIFTHVKFPTMNAVELTEIWR